MKRKHEDAECKKCKQREQTYDQGIQDAYRIHIETLAHHGHIGRRHVLAQACESLATLAKRREAALLELLQIEDLQKRKHNL